MPSPRPVVGSVDVVAFFVYDMIVVNRMEVAGMSGTDEGRVKVTVMVDRDVVNEYQELADLSGYSVSEVYRMQLKAGLKAVRVSTKALKVLGAGKKTGLEVMAAQLAKAAPGA